jgi:16S rRNA processing protein RimM
MGQRSTSRSTSDDDALVVGEIRGPHGVRGEVRLDPRSDIEGRFAPGATLDCDGIGPLTITSLRGTAGQPIVAFEGYDTREQASTLKGRFLRIARATARKQLAHGSMFWADLVGLNVETPDGTALGSVRELIRAGGADVLVVNDDERELLLPMIDSVVRSIDVAAGKIVATPLEGLE